MTIRRVITIVAVAVVGAALVGSAVAYANADDDPAAPADEAAAEHTDHTEHTGHGAPGKHGDHPTLTPYDERYAAAGDDEQASADRLRADVTDTLAAYADVDAAVAAGYRAPRRPKGTRWHYLNRTLAHDDDVLDPAHPEGLVYLTVEGRDPVLLGAFFVAPPGVEAPRPAGDLVVWHSHDADCPGFFATADAPCTDVRRMLHVWTADRVTVTGRGRAHRTAEVRVVDPFGAPFDAAVEVVRGERRGGT
jgi:hypothetical protein